MVWVLGCDDVIYGDTDSAMVNLKVRGAHDLTQKSRTRSRVNPDVLSGQMLRSPSPYILLGSIVSTRRLPVHPGTVLHVGVLLAYCWRAAGVLLVYCWCTVRCQVSGLQSVHI